MNEDLEQIIIVKESIFQFAVARMPKKKMSRNSFLYEDEFRHMGFL